jgi:hypothetical protein
MIAPLPPTLRLRSTRIASGAALLLSQPTSVAASRLPTTLRSTISIQLGFPSEIRRYFRGLIVRIKTQEDYARMALRISCIRPGPGRRSTSVGILFSTTHSRICTVPCKTLNHRGTPVLCFAVYAETNPRFFLVFPPVRRLSPRFPSRLPGLCFEQKTSKRRPNHPCL